MSGEAPSARDHDKDNHICSQVTWARFETSDINDPSLFGEPGLGGGAGLPLLLVLGYSSGVQV